MKLESRRPTNYRELRVVAFAGGVGGAKLAFGLARSLGPDNFTTVVNIGDDFEHYGLKICPDLDTVCYTLAGIANPETGWGRANETWNTLASLEELGGPLWFRLGDRDLGTHLERTRRLKSGETLSQITRNFCRRWGVASTVLPASDQAIPTWVSTEEGELPFQEYFVRRRCQPQVRSFRFVGVENAAPAPGVLDAIRRAELIVICPSNPWVSIDPLLAIPGIKTALEGHIVLAVSPIIGGQAVKGPAAKMYAELGIQPSSLAVARHYVGMLSGFILDHVDEQYQPEIEALGVRTLVTNTLMKSDADRLRLASEVLEFGVEFMGTSFRI